MRYFKKNLAIVPLYGCVIDQKKKIKIKIKIKIKMQKNKYCLRIIYSDKQSSFETLLEKDGSISIDNRNLQILATEMYEIKTDLSPLIVTDLFEQRNEQHCDLRNNSQFTILPVKTVYHHGSENKIWNILPDRLKNANSMEAFKM